MPVNAREQAWSVAGHIFVTSPVNDAERCCRARVYRVDGYRLERVTLPGGLGFEVQADTYRAAALKVLHRLETYLGARGQPVSMNLQRFVRGGTWTLKN